MESFTDFIYFRLSIAWKKIVKYYNSKSVQKYGISITQAYVLFCLLENNSMNIKALAEVLSVDNSAMTGLIDRMERDNLVERRVSKEDRRMLQIHLTDKGRKYGEMLFSWYRDINRKLADSLTSEQRSALDVLLKQADILE